MILLLHMQQATEKMDNNFSDGHYNKENEKNDEENRVPSSKKANLSSIKENLDDENTIENTPSYTEKEENVAENVKGVTSFTSHKDTDDAPTDGNNNETKKAAQVRNKNNGYDENDDYDQGYNNLKTTDKPECVIRDLEK